ncbi:hypothetical protein [Spongiimicrobium salis]|uniref:hypothetical protein n=1 Tax=Spongiimicrobium salis TaxID=1667022 RepID=UPI00374CE32F
MSLALPEFNTKREKFDFLRTNKDKLIAQKKSIIKEADGFAFVKTPTISKYGATKMDGTPIDANVDKLLVKAVINTTNIMDSHYDVHLPGLWKKSLSENRMIMHVQEHKSNMFDKIISDGEDLTAYTKNYTWKDLGYNVSGNTEALMFDSLVKKSRNPYMFDQYRDKYVRNHSVGMRYVKLVLCINDEENGGAEYEAWEKYIKEVINRDFAEDKGFFWAIKEARVIEGSAVPLGSNTITPTYSMEAAKALSQTNEAARALREKQVKFYLS